MLSLSMGLRQELGIFCSRCTHDVRSGIRFHACHRGTKPRLGIPATPPSPGGDGRFGTHHHEVRRVLYICLGCR